MAEPLMAQSTDLSESRRNRPGWNMTSNSTSDEDPILPFMSQGSYEKLITAVGEDYQKAGTEMLGLDPMMPKSEPSKSISSSPHYLASRPRPTQQNDSSMTFDPALICSVATLVNSTPSSYSYEHLPTAMSHATNVSTPSTGHSFDAHSTITESHSIDSNLNVLKSIQLHARPPAIVRQTSTGVGSGTSGFRIEIPQLSKQTKTVPWTYSEMLKKLYIKMDTAFKVNFSLSEIKERDMFIRAVPMFTEKQNRDDPVHACPAHTKYGKPGNYDSWLQIGNKYTQVEYEQDAQNHYTLRSRWSTTFSSMDITYQFVCRNVCVGGPNRRRTSVAFLLENGGGEVLAKELIEVKVSSCPGRDRTNDEKAIIKTELQCTVNTPKTKRVRFQSQEAPSPKKYYMEIKDEETYSWLSSLRDAIELSKCLPPEMKEHYLATSKHAALIPNQMRAGPVTSPTSKAATPYKHCSRHSSTKPSPDSSSARVEYTDHKVSDWLSSIQMNAYVDAFTQAGIVNMSQMCELGLRDFDNLQISLPHVKLLLEKLVEFRYSEPLSQASQSEAYGLYTLSRPAPKFAALDTNHPNLSGQSTSSED